MPPNKQWHKESPENYENYLISANLGAKRKRIAELEHRLSSKGISEYKAKLKRDLQKNKEEATELLRKRELWHKEWSKRGE